MTVKKAYDELEKEGYITTKQGKGSYVAEKNKELIKEEKQKEIENYITKIIEISKNTPIKKLSKTRNHRSAFPPSKTSNSRWTNKRTRSHNKKRNPKPTIKIHKRRKPHPHNNSPSIINSTNNILSNIKKNLSK